MSKKIIIQFNAQPLVGVAFDYTIQVDGLNVVYPNGLSNVTFEYEAFGGTDPEKVQIQATLTETIAATLSFLNTNYTVDNVFYAIVGNTIEVLINVDSPVVVYTSSINPSLSISIIDISNILSVGLKYFFEYKNIVNDTYKCEIYKKDYLGSFTEIHGTATIEKATVNNHLDPIRGGGVTLKLEASKDLTLEDLYSENEQDFTVKLYKNSKLIFQGYLNPDGVFQDYVRDEWVITLDCVDGLGAISNLSFVQDNGLQFTGKMLAMDIIYYCLKRTGVSMPINTSVNILYDGLAPGSDVFRKIYFDANRYVKRDDNTIMSCEEVLKSILDVFKACITQQDGEWYIYKPNEIFVQPIVQFRRFDINNVYLGINTVNLNKALGSHADNFYPHHCGANQRIEIKGSVGGFRINYKYGKVAGLLENPELVKTGHFTYAGWDVLDTTYLISDPFKKNGFYFKNQSSFTTLSPSVKTNPGLPFNIGDQISFTFKYEVSKMPQQGEVVLMEIKQGSKYLVYLPKDNNTPFDDISNAFWSTDPLTKFRFFLPAKSGEITINMPAFVVDGDLTIGIVGFDSAVANSTTYINYFDIKPTQSAGSPEGEFHTVERGSRVSTIVKENQTVYNGDNASIVYLGAIFDENMNPTSIWNRFNALDLKPVLQIAAEEELRIAQRPTKVFRGDFYGYIPYLSLVTINNIGKFMPIEWSYDTATNITSCKHLELFVAELNDIVYKYTIDFGETVKPTIK